MKHYSPLIKICGITKPEDADFSVRCGANMIGIVFVEGSKRSVSIELAKEINEATQKNGGKSVGVFTSSSIESICHICRVIKLDYAQIYHPFLEFELDRLQTHCKIIYANRVGCDGTSASLPSHMQDQVLLYDNKYPGSGVPFNWTSFIPPAKNPWILAGGLNSHNVKEAIAVLKPFGVDVSTGVERKIIGFKDQALIKQFIEEVRK